MNTTLSVIAIVSLTVALASLAFVLNLLVGQADAEAKCVPAGYYYTHYRAGNWYCSRIVNGTEQFIRVEN